MIKYDIQDLLKLIFICLYTETNKLRVLLKQLKIKLYSSILFPLRRKFR